MDPPFLPERSVDYEIKGVRDEDKGVRKFKSIFGFFSWKMRHLEKYFWIFEKSQLLVINGKKRIFEKWVRIFEKSQFFGKKWEKVKFRKMGENFWKKFKFFLNCRLTEWSQKNCLGKFD